MMANWWMLLFLGAIAGGCVGFALGSAFERWTRPVPMLRLPPDGSTCKAVEEAAKIIEQLL